MSTSPDQDSGPAVAAKVATVATAAAAAAVASDPTAVPVVATAAATAPTAAETNELSDSNDHEYALEPTSSYGSSSYVSSDDDEYDDDDYDEDEDDTDGEPVEYLSDAQAEWEESIAQIQSLLTCILIPVVGKFFGRRFSYFGTCVLTASFFLFIYLDSVGLGLVFWAVHGTGRSVDGTQTASETLFTSPTSTNSCIDFIYLLTLYFL